MMNNSYKVAALFSGAGGLDLGFQNAGFNLIWSNEFDSTIWDTHEINFPKCKLNKKSIIDVHSDELPDIDGLIGGPPCQSWSEAGARKGIDDSRGQLFFEYIRILKEKQPLFFLAENVPGILHKKHEQAFKNILNMLSNANYNVSYKLLNASNYGVSQDRKRVILVGFRKDLNKTFIFPEPELEKGILKDIIWDLKDNATPALEKNKSNHNLSIPNHEYMIGGFSSIYMSRNRVRSWDEPSFTIQAGGRHAPIHPDAPKMIFQEKDKFIFDINMIDKYRRLTVRECARVQSFPDNFILKYKDVADGYKMIGNAVPVEFARRIAASIKLQLIN